MVHMIAAIFFFLFVWFWINLTVVYVSFACWKISLLTSGGGFFFFLEKASNKLDILLFLIEERSLWVCVKFYVQIEFIKFWKFFFILLNSLFIYSIELNFFQFNWFLFNLKNTFNQISIKKSSKIKFPIMKKKFHLMFVFFFVFKLKH